MSRNELKTFLYVTVVVIIGMLVLLVWLLDGMQFGPQTLRRVPTAVTATLLFWLFFARWGWKWPPLNLIFKRPYVGGTWVGHLESNWQRGANNPRSVTLPILFIIRQTLFSVVIRSFTNHQEGLSDVANVVVKEEAGVTYLSYVYSLREEFRAGQGAQQGAAELRLAGKRIQELRGEYWTNMNTSGRLLLRRCSNEPTYSFKEACEKWPPDNWPKFDA
jgi:predicted pore-forming effector associated with SMODS systems